LSYQHGQSPQLKLKAQVVDRFVIQNGQITSLVWTTSYLMG
jgi:hypothetical protein